MYSYRPDETWHRLLDWTYGQPPSERLAVQILHASGFINISPSHPLGGQDGGKDAIAQKGSDFWVMAAYFPRGQKSFSKIKDKFVADLAGVARNNAIGIVFVTNQELRLAERSDLHATASSASAKSEIFHLESIAAILDTPEMYPTRKQFLYIDYNHNDIVSAVKSEITDLEQKLTALQTGGNSYCYLMLYNFNIDQNYARELVIIRVGGNTLYDIRVRIVDMNTNNEVFNSVWGEMSAPAEYKTGKFSLTDDVYLRIFFHARNGQWHQDLMLKKNIDRKFWEASTRVFATNGSTIRFEKNEFENGPDETAWRS